MKTTARPLRSSGTPSRSMRASLAFDKTSETANTRRTTPTARNGDFGGSPRQCPEPATQTQAAASMTREGPARARKFAGAPNERLQPPACTIVELRSRLAEWMPATQGDLAGSCVPSRASASGQQDRAQARVLGSPVVDSQEFVNLSRAPARARHSGRRTPPRPPADPVGFGYHRRHAVQPCRHKHSVDPFVRLRRLRPCGVVDAARRGLVAPPANGHWPGTHRRGGAPAA